MFAVRIAAVMQPRLMTRFSVRPHLIPTRCCSLSGSSAKRGYSKTDDVDFNEYENRLEFKAIKELRDGYLDFGLLKHCLFNVGEQKFEKFLQRELLRVLNFFVPRRHELIQQCRAVTGAVGLHTTHVAERQHLAMKIVELMEFAHLNAEGFRKIGKHKIGLESAYQSPTAAWIFLVPAFRCESLMSALKLVQGDGVLKHADQEVSDEIRIPKLVVFDKDGTLISFTGTWGPWIEHRVVSVSDELEVPNMSKEEVAADMYKVLGYLPHTKSVIGEGSLLAFADSATHAKKLIARLVNKGADVQKVTELVEYYWLEMDSLEHKGPLTPINAHVKESISGLQSRGIHIGVATTDFRSSTIEDLKGIGIADMIPGKAVSCGDDPIPAKPHPAQLLEICRHYGVHPRDSWMVGDTRADLLAARAAGFACVVGVRSGTGHERELRCDHWNKLSAVDIMLDDASNVFKVIERAPLAQDLLDAPFSSFGIRNSSIASLSIGGDSHLQEALRGGQEGPSQTEACQRKTS